MFASFDWSKFGSNFFGLYCLEYMVGALIVLAFYLHADSRKEKAKEWVFHRFWVATLIIGLFLGGRLVYFVFDAKSPFHVGLGSPAEYVYVEDDRIGLKEKAGDLPPAWRIVVSHDGKTPAKILMKGEAYSLGGGPAWVWFDPDTKMLPGAKPRDLRKIR